MAGCGIKCIKFTVFFFNFVFLLIGTALIIAGAYALASLKEYFSFLPATRLAPIMIIVIGTMIFVPAFFGCCGALRESRCMLITYAVLMGILLLLEVVIVIIGFVYGTKIRIIIELGVQSTISDYNKNPDVMMFWEIVQPTFDCCGGFGPNDWAGQLDGDNSSVPTSCCLNYASSINSTCDTRGILKKPQTAQKTVIYTEGCIPHIENIFKSIVYVICGVAIGIAVIELLGIVLSVCLSNAIRSEE